MNKKKLTLLWLTSAVMFYIYYFGYHRIRNVDDILILFAVEHGLALAYKMSGNLFDAYIVNLPNAFVTYMLKAEKAGLYRCCNDFNMYFFT